MWRPVFWKSLTLRGGAATGAILAPAINVIFLGYKRTQVEHPLDGLGFLSTKDPKRVISGAQFMSTMYRGRAPDGYVSISAYAGGLRNPELAALPDRDLIRLLHAELAEVLGIKGEPVICRTRRWALGLPQYNIGHVALQKQFLQTPERVEGLYLTGNYTQGVSVSSCLKSAAGTAQNIAEKLAGPMRKSKQKVC